MPARTVLLRLLVRCYPPAFRRRFGAELEAILDQMGGDPLNDHRPGLGPGTLRIAADLAASAAAEWRGAFLLRPEPATESPAAVRARLRGASPQRTAAPPAPAFTPLPGLRRRHGGRALPARAASF
jgi:hypothetical protein